jgi:hypothetical protein
MALKAEHEIHKRRLSRNIGVGGLLIGLVLVVFALTVVKVTNGFTLEGFDHAVRPSVTVEDGN